MSLYSRLKKERLFNYVSRFQDGGVEHQESIYYLIKDVQYDNKMTVISVTINTIIDVASYLELKYHRKTEDTFNTNIPQHILTNIKVWEMLLD